MTKLILVRHGETAWNDEARYQGQEDVPLSAKGCLQADRLAERLAQEWIDGVYSSDLARARDTATRIAGPHGRTVLTEPRLREVLLGAWQGLAYAEVHRSYFAPSDPMPPYAVDNPPPGGESLRQLQVRVVRAVEEIAAAHPDQSLVVVTHGACLKVLCCAWLGVDLAAHWKLSFSAASITRATLNPQGAVISTLNDTAHLDRKELP